MKRLSEWNIWDILTAILAAIVGILGAMALREIIKAWM